MRLASQTTQQRLFCETVRFVGDPKCFENVSVCDVGDSGSDRYVAAAFWLGVCGGGEAGGGDGKCESPDGQ